MKHSFILAFALLLIPSPVPITCMEKATEVPTTKEVSTGDQKFVSTAAEASATKETPALEISNPRISMSPAEGSEPFPAKNTVVKKSLLRRIFSKK